MVTNYATRKGRTYTPPLRFGFQSGAEFQGLILHGHRDRQILQSLTSISKTESQEINDRAVPAALTTGHPSIRKSWH
jgi:hypothetical protein